MAGRISFHARRLYISFGRYNPWAAVWENLYRGFMAPVTQVGYSDVILETYHACYTNNGKGAFKIEHT
jgi:hypothetical protein